MRITTPMLTRLGISHLNDSRTRLARTQEQATLGLRINRPSDDPVDYQVARTLKGSISETSRFLRSVDSSRSRLNTTESGLIDAVDLLSEARALSINAANTPSDSVASPILRDQVESLFDRLLASANTRSSEGAYVFSGHTSDVRAFSQTGAFVSGSPPPTVSFGGDGNQIAVEIDQGTYVDVTLDGSRVFQGGVDAFSALATLWSGLDETDPALRQAQISQAIGELDLAHTQLVSEQAGIGMAGATVERVEDRLQVRAVELASRLSQAEDADVFQVNSDLVAQEAALQATLQVTSSLLGPSLLDFI